MKNISGLLLKGPGKVEFCKNLEDVFKFVPAKGQLLVQMKYAPVNPSDFYFYKNVYHDKKEFPCVPGFEGYGVIEQAGDEDHQHLVGKPCAVLALSQQYGTYASHTISQVTQTVILDELPDPQTFEFLINPITALGLLEKAHLHGATSFIQNGASTSVAKLILFYNGKTLKMPSINVVRNIAHKSELEFFGATEVLSSADPDYLAQLQKAIGIYKPTAAFDCLGGRPTGELFNRLPPKSVQWVYGLLELKPMEGLDGMQIIFTGKQLHGFHLVHDLLKGKDLAKFEKDIRLVAKEFKQQPGIKAFDLEQFDEAFQYFPHKKEKQLFKCS